MRCTRFIAVLVHIIGVAFVFAGEAPLLVFGRSLDGQMTLIATVAEGEGDDRGYDLVLEHTDGTRVVVHRSTAVKTATFSPDGEWIAYTSVAGDLSVVPSARPSEIRLLHGHVSETAWEPHARSVAYTRRDDEGVTNIWFFDLSTQRERQLTNDAGQSWQPLFAPDGDRLLYVSARTGIASLWILDLREGTDMQITNRDLRPGRGIAGATPVPLNGRSTSWSSDDVLAWSSEEGVFVMNLKRGTLRKVHDVPGAPKWRANGSQLEIVSRSGTVVVPVDR